MSIWTNYIELPGITHYLFWLTAAFIGGWFARHRELPLPFLPKPRKVAGGPVTASGASARAADAAHDVVQLAIDHPDQHDALIQVAGALTTKAAMPGAAQAAK